MSERAVFWFRMRGMGDRIYLDGTEGRFGQELVIS
jgi:hypothetical protein